MIYEAVVQLRNYLYNKRILEVEKLKVPVISVGNMTVGGTGKSPMTISLLKWAQENKLRPGVISRGYGRTSLETLEVDLQVDRHAEEFGDEPCMIKAAFPKVPIYVGADRVLCGRSLLLKHDVNFLIADDAFQHRRLYRDLDVVMVDAMRPNSDYRVLPFGRGRETFSGIGRAHFAILNKVNFVSTGRVQELRSRILSAAPSLTLIESSYFFSGCKNSDNEVLPEGKRIFIFAGLARPESFQRMVSEKFHVVGSHFFKDHHLYSKSNVDQLVKEAKKLGAAHLVTTEKDTVKLRGIPQDFPVWTATIEMKFSDEIRKLQERILELDRKNSFC